MKIHGALGFLALLGLTAIPAFGQMTGTPTGGKVPSKSAVVHAAPKTGSKAVANTPAKNMMMCCMSGMKMDKMMSSMSVTNKQKMGKCCMAGMKSAGMKMGDMKMSKGDMEAMMSHMSAGEKKKMGKCCMIGMKSADTKPSSKGMSGGIKMGDDKKPSKHPMGSGMGHM